jgi:hypothetical protein
VLSNHTIHELDDEALEERLNAGPGYYSTDGAGPNLIRVSVCEHLLAVARAFAKKGRTKEATTFEEFFKEATERRGGHEH